MYELDKMQYVNPIFNFSLDGKIKEDNGRLRRITRRDIKESAKNIANTLSSETDATVYDYLKNNIILNGSKGRQRLFNKTIQKELAPYILDPTKMDAKTLSSLSPEEKAAVSRYWRDPKRLIGQIGGGIEDPIANQHAREYVSGLVDPAVTMIGATMGMTNPITTAALTEGGTALKEALPYIDKGVNVVKNWWAKPRSWYNPVQTLKTLINPKNANTAIGEAAASTADLAGVYYSAKANEDLINKWRGGDFHHSDIPQFGLNVAGMLPGMQYFNDYAPAVAQAGKWMIEDTANTFRSLMNKEVPVLGIANLPNASRVVNTPQLPTWRGTQWDDLDSGTRAELIRSGLGRWDIQALLDRGYTPEQLRWFNDDFGATVTRNITGNRRANVLAERLANAGIAPEQMSRREFLENAMRNGYEIGLDEYYYPRLLSEIGEGQSVSQIPDGYLERFYPDLTVRPNTDVYNGGKYLQMRGHIVDALRILSPEEHAEMAPKIRAILEEGVKSELSPEALEKQVELLFNIKGKPFYRPKKQYVPKGRKVTEIIDPETGLSKSRFVQDVDESGNPLFYTSHKGSAESMPYGKNWAANDWTLEQALDTPNPTNTAISLNEYTRETVPLRFTDDDLDWAYNHYMLFDVNQDELAQFRKLINEATPHGGTNLEFSKSLQSNVVANAALRDKQWVPLFFGLSDVPGQSSYRYDRTNGLEHALWNPRANNPNKPWDLMDAVNKTTGSTEAYLNNMPVDVFKAFGAEIDPKTGMFVTESQFGKQRLKGFPTYRFELRYPSGDEKYIELPYTYIPSSIQGKPGRFKFIIPDNWDGMKTLKRFNDALRAAPSDVQQRFKVALHYPLVGGRKLKLGGILHNINRTVKSTLNIK